MLTLILHNYIMHMIVTSIESSLFISAYNLHKLFTWKHFIRHSIFTIFRI